MVNPKLTLPDGTVLVSPDLYLPEEAVAVMVHGRQFHGGELQWDATVEDDGGLVAAGIVVVAVTPNSIRHRPAETLARIEKTWLMARDRRDRPEIVVDPRHAA